MNLKPVYYIFGTDDYLADIFLNEIKEAALTGGFASMNLQVFESKDLDAMDVVNAAMTMPAFSDKRLVIIKNADKLKADCKDALLEYVKDPAPSTCLVFLSNETKTDGKNAFVKFLSEKGYLKQCNRLGDAGLSDWIIKYAKKNGKEIASAVAGKLVQITGDRLRDVKGELDKLLIYVGESAVITAADVEDSGMDCREETTFALSDAIAEKNIKRALAVYKKVSDEAALMLLGAIARQMRTLLKLKALIRKKTDRARIAPLAGFPPFLFDKYQKSASRFTETELKRALALLNTADTDLKTGRLPDELIMQGVIMDLCLAGRS